MDAASHGQSLNQTVQIVVADNEGSRLFGDLRTSPTHGHTNMCSAEGRPVVHSVARHGDDLTRAFECIDDAQFGFGKHARENIDVIDLLAEYLLWHVHEFLARQTSVRTAKFDLLGDGRGGFGVVTRDDL